MALTWFLAGALAGAVAATAWAQRRAAAARRESEAAAELRIAELRQSYETRWRDSAQAGAELRTQLEALLPQVAETVLSGKAKQLEQIAGADLKLLGQQTVHAVTQSQQGLEAAVKNVGTQLADYQARLQGFETERAAAQGRLHEQLAQLMQTGSAMAQEARTLRDALATSGGVKGRWGEAVLKNILDASELNEHVDYDLQVTDDTGRLRPDAIIRLPSGRRLVVDAKASLAEFAAGLEAGDDDTRRACFTQFAAVLRRMASDLSRRAYSDQIDGSLPYVVMFVPSEAAFRAAADADPKVFEYGQNLRPPVLLASPSTLVPLAMLVREGWQQQQASRQMVRLLAEVQEFGARLLKFHEHIQQVGKKLDDAGRAYNQAAGSYQRRVAPQWERVNELGAGWEEAPAIAEVENPLAGTEPRPQLLPPKAAAAGDE